MNIRTQLLQEHSKNNTQLIVDWIGSDTSRFNQIMNLFLNDEALVVQRAAWVVGICGELHPELAVPYIEQMIKKCQEPKVHDAVKRNVTRIFQFLSIPVQHHESVMNLCFDLLVNPKETVAVRCWSMGILEQLSNTYSELKNELKIIIENALEHEELSAGFINKSNRVLKHLK